MDYLARCRGSPRPIMAGAEEAICVPVRGQDEHVELRPSELPDDESSVTEMLMGEMAPLDVWRQVAVRTEGLVLLARVLGRGRDAAGRAAAACRRPAVLTALPRAARPSAPPTRSPTTASARQVK